MQPVMNKSSFKACYWTPIFSVLMQNIFCKGTYIDKIRYSPFLSRNVIIHLFFIFSIFFCFLCKIQTIKLYVKSTNYLILSFRFVLLIEAVYKICLLICNCCVSYHGPWVCSAHNPRCPIICIWHREQPM